LEPGSAPYDWLGQAYEADGQYLEALNSYERSEKVAEGADSREIETRFERWRSALATNGPEGMWQAMMDHFKADPYQMASLYARMGNEEKALDLLEEALRQGSGRLNELLVDHYWRHLRGKPRFQQVVRQMGFKPKEA